MSQYTTQLLMPDVDRCIDDVEYENYNIPVMQYGQRVLKQRDRQVQLGGVYEFGEADYVDAREPRTYSPPDVEFAPALTAEQHARLHATNALLQSMVNGGGCTGKQLKRVLTAEQYLHYVTACADQQHHVESDYGDGMPDDLHSYKSLLQQADFYYNRFDRLSSLRSSGRVRYTEATIKTAENKAEALYEDALERLEEIWECASPYEQHYLQNWMDRELDFDVGHNRTIGIDPVSIPRVRGSKSANALDTGLPKLSKRLKRRQCQLMALRDAAWNVAFLPAVETQPDPSEISAQSTKLKELLRKIGRDDDDDY